MAHNDPTRLGRSVTPSEESLQKEKEALSQQVKRLIRAEGELYDYQQELDEQLKEYKELYELNRRLNASFDLGIIYRETVAYVIHHLGFERAVLFAKDEETGSYAVRTVDGYYDAAEKSLVSSITLAKDEPCLSPLTTAGKEYLVCEAGSGEQEPAAFCSGLYMDECFIYPLGCYALPHALLVVGNSAENSAYYRRVTERPGALLSMGNLVGLVSSLIESRISYEKFRRLNVDLEQRVKESVDELRRKDKILVSQGRQAIMGEMLNNIAHQWRQPLNMLALLVQDLQMTKKVQGLSDEYIDTNVKRSLEVIKQMSTTIDDFRYFFRQDKEKVPFRVLESIEKALSILEGSLQVQGIRTEVIQKDEPVVTGYPTEFVQVLLNILVNARDALIDGPAVLPLISIKAQSEGGRAIVIITDNAGGIPAGIIDHIFEPYFTTKGPEQGTGIGLFMSRIIIEKNMNGRLTVRNVGGGAEFRIEV